MTDEIRELLKVENPTREHMIRVMNLWFQATIDKLFEHDMEKREHEGIPICQQGCEPYVVSRRTGETIPFSEVITDAIIKHKEEIGLEWISEFPREEVLKEVRARWEQIKSRWIEPELTPDPPPVN